MAVAESTVWEILKTAGIEPSPQRASVTWAAFLRSQAEATPAMDFIETITLTWQRQYILVAIHHATRRVRVLGVTTHPTHVWVTQAVRNLLLDLEDAGSLARVMFLIRDRDGKYPVLIDEILAGAGITTVLTGVRAPRMNSIMERGLTPDEWTPRELRHSFVSLLSDDGVPIERISLLVGHSGTTVTEAVYRHQIRPMVQDAAGTIDRLFPAP